MSAADSVNDFVWSHEADHLKKVYLLGGKENLRWYYTSYWIKALDYYAKSLSQRVLPSFNDISEEVVRVEEETYNRLASLIDPADIGDQVGHAMGDFLTIAEGIVQGIINLFTTGLQQFPELSTGFGKRRKLISNSRNSPPALGKGVNS